MEALMSGVMALSFVWTNPLALLVDVAIKSLVVLIAAFAIVSSLRKSFAAARHLVWCVAVCGLLVLPAVALIVPKWTVPGLAFLSPTTQQTEPLPAQLRAETSAEDARVGEGSVGRVDAGAIRSDTRAIVPQVTSEQSGYAGTTALARIVPAGPAASEVSSPSPERGVVERDWTLALPAIWFVGVFVVAVWIVGGLVRSWLLVRSAREVTHGPVAWLFNALSEELALAGRVKLLATRSGTMPMAWGVRARILLPADADDWTDARLRAVLLHELAHVRRRDFVTQLLARFTGALYWFNPLVWVAIHRMRVERELACDDHVLCTGSRASDYASHLLEIARLANGRAFASYGGVAMARRSRLSDRLLAVLDHGRRRSTVTPRLAFAAWAGAACFLLPVAGARLGTVAENEARAAAERAASVSPESTDPAPVFDAFASRSPKPSPSNRETTTGAPLEAVPAVSQAPTPPLTWFDARLAQGSCDWYAHGANTSNWMSGEDDDYQVRITMDDCRLDLEIAGEILFNDEETDIVNVSRRGYFEMEERAGRSRRRIVIERNGGDLVRSWFVDGDEQPYGNEASSWLAHMIPLLFRRVGLQAEERAARILDRRGVDGVLLELSQIPSDYVARKYYQMLLTDGDLDATQLGSIVRQAGDELESDYELAQLLVEVAENHPVDESVMAVYVAAAGSLESDYEQRRALDAILSRQDLSQGVAEAMLRLATELESDYELAELLIGILNRHPVDEVLTREFFDAINTLDSDYEHNRVLKVALHAGAPNMQVLDLSLESATNIDSDYERAELLLEVARLYPVDQNIPASYLVAAQSLDSDYELGRVLKYLIDNQRLSEDALELVLDASLKLDSDYEVAEVLLAIVGRYELTDRERDVYFRAVTSLESDYELGRVLRAIVEQGPLNEQNLRSVLTSAREFGSEYELANLLICVADNHTLNADLRALYMRSVDTISSDYERGRVLSALNPRGGRSP